VADLLRSASGGRVTIRTQAPEAATRVLQDVGGQITASGPDTVTVSGIESDRVVTTLSGNGVPFSEVSTHRASLEDAYLELTRDSVQYRAVDASEPVR
jgi:ABC-2 type transport system ATP-binding protein